MTRTKRAAKESAPPALSPAPEPQPVLAIIRALQSREILPEALGPGDRRACVEHLLTEGSSVAEAAAILNVCERTILRDRRRLRAEHAVSADPSLLPETVGRLFFEADVSMGRLRRIAREKGASAQARAEAERAAWSVLRDLVRLLQGLGYLPTAEHRVRAEVTHRAGEDEGSSLVEIEEELARLLTIRERCGADGDDGLDIEITTARSAVRRLVVAAKSAQGTEPDQGIDDVTKQETPHDD